jgi:Zn-dependent protease
VDARRLRAAFVTARRDAYADVCAWRPLRRVRVPGNIGARAGVSSRMGLAVGTFAVSLALYSALWGLPLSLGLLLGMAAHELGHMLVLRHLKLPFSAPIFVPLVGAAVRAPITPWRPSDAMLLALAGPAAGMGFALLCLLGHVVTGVGLLFTLAWLHALLNLVDLIPLGPLDGGRAWRAWRQQS